MTKLYLSRFLQESKACTVDVVEIDPDMTAEARSYCRQLAVADLQNMDLARFFGDARYDYIVCADILEHMLEKNYQDNQRLRQRITDIEQNTAWRMTWPVRRGRLMIKRLMPFLALLINNEASGKSLQTGRKYT